MPKDLFLCSGTGSVGEPFREAGWEVTDVDWCPRFNPEIVIDTTTWDYKAAYEPGHFDVIWASPDCTQYSRARTRGGPRDFEKADCLVQACRNIIEYLQPNYWFLENPDSGDLKTRPCISGLPYKRVDYCMYGTPYRKRTRIWTNCTDWTPKLCDRSHCINGKHIATAQRGSSKSDDKTFTRDDLHRLPKELCEELFSVCCISINDVEKA